MKLSQGLFKFILVFILVIVSVGLLQAQNSLNYIYNETGSTTPTSSETFSTVTSAELAHSGTNAVLVVANFELSSTNAGAARDGILQITDGATTSHQIHRTMTKGGNDFGIGTLVHLFSYSGSSTATTYTLEHATSDGGRGITTEAMLSIFEVNNSSVDLDYEFNEIITGVAAGGTMDVVSGMETGAVTLAQPGGIYVAASFNTYKLGTADVVSDIGSWVLRYRKGTEGNFTAIGNSISRTIGTENNLGAASLVFILEDQEPDDYYFQLAHLKSSGDNAVYTSNANLIALGLTHATGVFPCFSEEVTTASTTTTGEAAISFEGTPANDNTAFFMHAQFNMTASAELLLPTFSFNMTDGDQYDFNSLTLNRYISGPTDIGSGALASLSDGLVSGITYTASLMHGTPDAGITLTSSNMVLSGFQLTDIPTNIWTGDTDNDWHDATNWSESIIPISTTDVYIPTTGITNFPVITSSADCRNLTIEGANLTLSSSVSSVASLIVSGIPFGTATYESYITADQWHIMSSPVAGQSIDDFLTNSSNGIAYHNPVYAMTDYNESAPGSWNSYFTASGNGLFGEGKGYLVGRSSSDGTVSFTGTVIADTVLAAVTKTDRGWNSIGNPFTSAIGANESASSDTSFLEVNVSLLDPSHMAIYVWIEQETYDGTRNDFRAIANSGYSDPDLLVGINYAQAGQGFMINAASSGNINFTPSMQYHYAAGLLKSTKTSWDGFKLIAQKDEDKRSCIVSFNWNMTLGLDPSYDAGMLKDAGSFAVYTRLAEEDNDIDFEIQSLPDRSYEDIIVPVGLDVQEDGYVKFSLAGIILDDDKSVIFEDRELNKFVTFNSEEDFYETNIVSGTSGIGRFYLHLSLAQPNSIYQPEEEDNKYTAYWNGSQIVLQGKPEISTRAILIDLNGRLLGDYSLNYLSENYLSIPNKRNGIYFLRIVEGNTVTSLKIPVF